MMINKSIPVLIAVLLMLTGTVLAQDESELSEAQFCQAEAQQAGVTDEEEFHGFVSQCLQGISVCKAEAREAGMDTEEEFNDYVTQCLEEFLVPGNSDSESDDDIAG